MIDGAQALIWLDSTLIEGGQALIRIGQQWVCSYRGQQKRIGQTGRLFPHNQYVHMLLHFYSEYSQYSELDPDHVNRIFLFDCWKQEYCHFQNKSKTQDMLCMERQSPELTWTAQWERGPSTDLNWPGCTVHTQTNCISFFQKEIWHTGHIEWCFSWVVRKIG